MWNEILSWAIGLLVLIMVCGSIWEATRPGGPDDES